MSNTMNAMFGIEIPPNDFKNVPHIIHHFHPLPKILTNEAMKS